VTRQSDNENVPWWSFWVVIKNEVPRGVLIAAVVVFGIVLTFVVGNFVSDTTCIKSYGEGICSNVK
jgi:hypothetical protein